MTFEQLFRARMLLMSAQRHIAQEFISYPNGESGPKYRFRTQGGAHAFLIVERLLCELEREFESKKNRCDRRKRQSLDRRADRQVLAS